MMRTDNAGAATFPELFEAQATCLPAAIALICEGEQLTYAQLNARANRLAHHLIAEGVGPEQIVAMALPRSVEMVTAVLGIMKAGAAYLPLDPEYPMDRLAYMIADARPARLITTREIGERLAADVTRICIDDAECAAAISQCPDSDPENEERSFPLLPAHPAYVIYTSGSTGRPKGVMVTHAGIANLAVNQIERFAVTPDSRVLQFASISFDAAFSELCLGLLSGGALIVAPASRLLPGEPLAKLALETGMTHVTLPPTVLAEMAPGSLPACRTLIVAGEACPPYLVGRWSAGRKMINAYGPTETTVCATMSDALAGAVSPPLGQPLANTEIYLLDENLRPVDAGMPGEIYVAGCGLARGYLGRPDLTAERFLPNPFGAPGSRMYRTGDLASRGVDGTLTFLGRADHQVKIRGFRIEPGEIESVLARHPHVDQAAVVAREDSVGQLQLVAYVVPAANAKADAAELRRHAGESLPDYMVPAFVVALDALPLTPNGKLDRKALPEPQLAASNASAPRNAQEKRMAELFAEILGIEEFGMEDSFFDLGGHSLSATRLISRIRSTLGVELELDDVFDTPTVAGLAARLAPDEAPAFTRPEQGIVAVDRKEALPMSYSQQRLWFIHEHMPGQQTSYNMLVALRLHGDLSIDALRAACNDLVARHETLRTTFAASTSDGDEVLQRVAPALTLDIPLFDVKESELPWRIALHAAHVFDLANGPLVKIAILKAGEDDHVLLINMHHIVSDGWSLSIMNRDLQALYAARLTEQRDALPALTIQYADYAHWQRRQDLSASLAYWKEALAGYQDGIELPYDYPRPPQRVWRAATFHYRYPESLSRQAARFSQENQATLFMTVLSAFAIVLNQYTGRTDLCIGTTTAGRDHVELESLIGFFINILPLRIDLSGDPSASEILRRTKAAALKAFEHQALPFEQLLGTLKLQRDDSRIPLVPVMLRHQNFPMASADFTLGAASMWAGGLAVKPVPCGERPANSELDVQFFGDGSSLEVSIEYAADLFSEATIERLAQHHHQVLEMLAFSEEEEPVSGSEAALAA